MYAKSFKSYICSKTSLPLLLFLKVQYVYNTPLNVYTPNLQIINSSLMSNN